MQTSENPSVVYFCPRITADNLVNVYKALGREAKGRVAIKVSNSMRQATPIISALT